MVTVWTTLGSILIPLAFVVDIEIPKTPSWVIYALLIFGFGSILMGLIYYIHEERHRREEMYLFALMVTGIAEKMGVDMDKIANKLEENKYGKSKRIKTESKPPDDYQSE
jgi:hypothetical protein